MLRLYRFDTLTLFMSKGEEVAIEHNLSSYYFSSLVNIRLHAGNQLPMSLWTVFNVPAFLQVSKKRFLHVFLLGLKWGCTKNKLPSLLGSAFQPIIVSFSLLYIPGLFCFYPIRDGKPIPLCPLWLFVCRDELNMKGEIQIGIWDFLIISLGKVIQNFWAGRRFFELKHNFFL